MSASRPVFALRLGCRRRRFGLAVMVALAALWLAAASRVHVNVSWSDEAWGYAALPLFGEDPTVGDRVLFEPPDPVGSRVPYLKTVRGVPGMRIIIRMDRTVFLDGRPVGRAKPHALDGRPLDAIAPGVIPPGHFYLHADHRDSHDSRYAEIGLVPRGRILGRALTLPDVPWLGLKGPLVGPEGTGRPDGAATILPHPADTSPPAREEDDAPSGSSPGRSPDSGPTLGWHFYCDRQDRNEEHIVPQASPPSADNALSATERIQAMRKALEEARAEAILDPTRANVTAYLRLQQETLQRAAAFSDAFRRTVWATPALDYTLRRPVGALAKQVWSDERRDARDRALARLGERYGLIYLGRAGCAGCKVFGQAKGRGWAR